MVPPLAPGAASGTLKATPWGLGFQIDPSSPVSWEHGIIPVFKFLT